MIVNIYLVCAEINGERLHKIGYTKRRIEERIKEFKTGNASEFYIIDSFKSEWGTKIEANLKRKFKIYNIRGEWFNLPQSEIDNFYSYCKKFNYGSLEKPIGLPFAPLKGVVAPAIAVEIGLNKSDDWLNYVEHLSNFFCNFLE